MVRIFLNILAFLGLFFFPWWLSILLWLLGVFLFKHYFEIFVFALMMDFVHGIPVESFGGFSYFYSALALVFYILISYFRTIARVYNDH